MWGGRGIVTRGFCMHALLPESLHRIMIQMINIDNSMSDAIRRPFRACRTSNSINYSIGACHRNRRELDGANANRVDAVATN